MKTITKLDQVAISLDFDEIFGMPVKDSELRQAIADDIIETITERTKSGYGVENGKLKKFKPYSKAYAQKVGKARSPVDLDSNGDLLNAIHLISDDKKGMLIGIDDENAPKAHGHMTGQYGKGPLPRRSFLGLTDKDIRQLKSKYQTEVQSKGFKKMSEYLDQTKEDVQKLGLTREDILDALASLSKISLED